MAKQVDVRIFGVDVAKGWLDIYTADQGGVERIDNSGEAIETWLRGVTGPVWVAVEATNRYHERFIEQAHGQGHRVYVIDAFKLVCFFLPTVGKMVGAGAGGTGSGFRPIGTDNYRNRPRPSP